MVPRSCSSPCAAMLHAASTVGSRSLTHRYGERCPRTGGGGHRVSRCQRRLELLSDAGERNSSSWCDDGSPPPAVKDIIVTSTGEKIAPVDLETAIMSDPLFEQAMVIGEGRPYVAALVVLNREDWQRTAARLGEAGSPPSRQRQEVLLQRIAEAVQGFLAAALLRLPLRRLASAQGLATKTLQDASASMWRARLPIMPVTSLPLACVPMASKSGQPASLRKTT